MTAPVVFDVVKHALQQAAWHRDVPRDCRCPHTWNPELQQWARRDGATCGKHPS